MLQTNPIPLTERLPILGIRVVQRLLETVFGVLRGVRGLRRPWVSFLRRLKVCLLRRVGNVVVSVLCLPKGDARAGSYTGNELRAPRFRGDVPNA